MTGTKGLKKWGLELLAPVDAASLALFRILFGFLLFIIILRFFTHGWIDQLYIQPRFFFSFFGFTWIQSWPAWGMYLHFSCLGLLALGITFGCYYRVCTILFFLGLVYVELLDVTNYLNHYYLVGLICFLLIFLPAARSWSFDAKEKNLPVPFLAIWILRLQISLVYFYAGLGKLQSDWLFHAQPLRLWLSARSDLPWIGTWLQEPWLAYAISWSSAAYDLTIPFWLIWSRTRLWAFLLMIIFHSATAFLFPTIGMFPWLMIALTTLFFSPSWPRSILQKFSHKTKISPKATLAEFPIFKLPRISAFALFAYFSWQLLWPLRHHLYPGNNLWTEEGFRFSWNVMLMEKSGHTEFSLQRPGSVQRERTDVTSWLTPLQYRMMTTQPDLILQTARKIAQDEKLRSGEIVEVYAETWVSLNGRPPFSLVDPKVNLAAQKDSFLSKTWIAPSP